MNSDIAHILAELSILYEMKGVAFKPRAMARASEVLQNLSTDVQDLYEDGGHAALERIPGIGPGIADRIEEFITHGKIAEHMRLKKALPVDIVGITAIEGIGPKTLALLYRKLNIRTRAQLERAARTGKLAAVRGIGPKGQERILRSMRYLEQSGGRTLPGLIWPALKEIADRLAAVHGVKALEMVGSLRRMQETIGDLDLLAVTEDPERVLSAFVTLPQVRSVYSHGQHRALVRLAMGMDADLAAVPAESYGAALIAWTGNKSHNVHLRTLAKKKRYLLDDYGLFRNKHMVAGRSEEEVYRALGLQWIPPELRSDTGEIEAAAKKELPRLVGYADVKGDLQVQTDWSDGEHSILQMAKAAQAAGLEYIAITDHTKSLTIAHGLDEQRLHKQWAEIDRVQKLIHGLIILKGSECDIKKNGSLDLSEAALARLDVVGISVHSHMDMSAREQTARIIRAMEHPRAHILFHPTGRLIGRRSPYALDTAAVIRAAKRTGTVLEVNAYPDRLDLNDEHIRQAVAAGVRLSIDTDAHSTEHFAYLRWGIGTARRGWAQKKDVINTRPVKQMLRLLK